MKSSSVSNKAVSKDLAYGVRVTHRTVNNGMDDFCGSTGIGQWMKDNGYTKWSEKSLCHMYVDEPSQALNINADVNNDGNYIPVTIPNSYIRLPKYERTYDDLQIRIDRPYDGKWGLGGSYTYARNRGTL